MVYPTRLLPKHLVDDLHQALARLRFARSVDVDHPVVPTRPRRAYCSSPKCTRCRPHPVDCDICVAQRRIDLLLDEISKAIGKIPKVSTPPDGRSAID